MSVFVCFCECSGRQGVLRATMTTLDLRTVVLGGLNIYESLAVQEEEDVNSEVAA